MTDDLTEKSLHYHRHPRPGKLAINPTKPMLNQHDLALAYSPGVAIPCQEIAQDSSKVGDYTNRSNAVAVITNGTAVLGLGNIGPLAAKPVMEGKAVLFKKFADIDGFDIEINENDPAKLVDIIASLEPTFGGINLEDIKAPECFWIEQQLSDRLKIPVFHDDQHGTAIIVTAAILNGLKLLNKQIGQVKIVVSGAGAAALACLNLLVSFGLKKSNIIISDRAGIVYHGRSEMMDEYKREFATSSKIRDLSHAFQDADIFLGLSVGGVITPAMIEQMVEEPIILALANPTPEIWPEAVKTVRPKAIIATGRSDYVNQVNNLICFPYIFRGAMDVGAIKINTEMKQACVKAIADLAISPVSDIVANAYRGQSVKFGRDLIIPKPFDPRLLTMIAPAVAEAAMASGVATRPIADIDVYKNRLSQFSYRSGLVMKPLFDRAKGLKKKVAYVEGEEPRVLQAAQMIVDQKIASPVLIGSTEIIEQNIDALGLSLEINKDVTIIDFNEYCKNDKYYSYYHQLMERRGISPDIAQETLRYNPTVLGALMLEFGEIDALICGANGRYLRHLQHLYDIIGKKVGLSCLAAMELLLLDKGMFFICDTQVSNDPTAQEIADMTLMAAHQVKKFGLIPKIALLSHSNFGAANSRSALKMAQAFQILQHQAPELEIEGEMQAEIALSESLRKHIFPNSRLQGCANLLIMPNIDAANISYNLLRSLGDGISIGPILLGMAKSAHILTPTVTPRGILNITAVAVLD